MLQKALEFLVGLKAVQKFEINGETYSTEKLHHVDEYLEPAPRALEIHTLQGIVDYIKEDVDQVEDQLIVHIESPVSVRVFTILRDGNVRHHFLDCKAITPHIPFGQFMDTEQFIIMLQSNFIDNADKAAILSFVGNISSQDETNIRDNGITQEAVAKTGIATVGNVTVPNPVTLFPFRTFPEIDQPSSKYVFRIRKGQQGPQAALFDADNGIWRTEAILTIKNHLAEALKDTSVKIIS